MNFEQALTNLKDGKHLQREGWNGKGMFIFLVEGRNTPYDKFVAYNNQASTAIKKAYDIGKITDVVSIKSHIDMINAKGELVTGWVASQEDLQATDWVILD